MMAQIARLGFLGLAVVLLSGCFFQPGRFEATMQVMADGRFSYAYEGEIVMSGMLQLEEMAAQADNSQARPCYDEDTFEERACSQAELAERADEQRRGQAMMAAMFGGVDLSDPEAGAALATTIERQAGWQRVEYQDEGVFSVSFAINSTLSHDFDFPTLEGFPIGNSFVSARLRDGNRVRIEAPGFSVERANNPMSAMMLGMAGSAASAAAEAGDENVPPQFLYPVSGKFRLITDARILANNTDEGPQNSPEGEVLEWAITPDTATAPTALLELNRQ